MIVPMIKYQFLVYHKELEAFLEALRDQGVVDITVPSAKFPSRKRPCGTK